ncbi:MAG TPA: enoyl-CoA hydratase-related protein [Dehalococcoidia bacterium]|nr:enoyl-CoA hydratase-related protein [Dehalococcoidia bacterium]
MEYETVILEKKDTVAIITLNRPQRRNAFNARMLEEFVRAREDVATDTAMKVLIITGAGSAFCSGSDFSSDNTAGADMPAALRMREAIISQERQMLDLRKMPKPVIAMVNGPVIGAGLGFFLSSDMAVAAENAIFGFGFARLGLHPEAGITYILPRIIGMARACELLFLGKTIDAREAEKLGLVNQVVPGDRLADATMELALSLAAGPSVAIGLAKISLYNSWAEGIRSALENEARANAICVTTEDYAEAVKAFREKRNPVFKGR